MTGHDPIETAVALTASVEGLTQELRSVRWRARVLTVVVAIVVILVLGMGYLHLEVRRTQERACEAGNDVRSGLQKTADYLEPIIADDAEGQGLVEQLREDFALRDCE